MSHMPDRPQSHLEDTGERMIPTGEGEVSVVFSRHQFTYRYAQQFAEGKDILDLGCGTGYGSAILAEQADHVVGVDNDAQAIDYCRAHFGGPNVVFEQADATALPMDREFDMAVSFQVIEHVHDAGAFVDLLKMAVKNDGLIMITTPNARSTRQRGKKNPFHFSEMNYSQFRALIASKFGEYKILGIGPARKNTLSRIVELIPFYRSIGLRFKRSSIIKKIAVQAMDLTRNRVIEDDVARQAIDLLAVCTNRKSMP